ncbi:hypothetical protein DL767_008087 [Monosporascus sp. MG133]|nr:hypothetical protein DL767_008087 [Monosporascus sp. MG133]
MAIDDGRQSPKKFAVVLFRGFQALDAFGPLDILNMLSSYHTPLELYVLAETLDPVPTKAHAQGGYAMSQSVVPTHTFESAPRDIEVLLVPGGFGTRDRGNVQPAVDFVRSAFPRLRYLLTVCTGSALVAMSGVLDGRRATSNKKASAWVKSQGPNVRWVLEARWVTDGNVWTASGISAGIDMAYAFVSEMYGEDIAQELADRAEYTRQKDPSVDPFAKFAKM